MVQLRTKCKLPTYASAITLQQLAQEFEYMMYCLDAHAIEEYDTVSFDGVRYTALPVRHSPGSFGYLIETDTTRMFYASDTGLLPEETKERIQGCDILAMDATFWKRCWRPDAHHSIQETIEEGLALDANKIYLTHLALHYDEPITTVELDAYLEQYGGRVEQARDGMSFQI